jgi:uncharacterized protein
MGVWSSLRSWLAPAPPPIEEPPAKPELSARIDRPSLALDHEGMQFMLEAMRRQSGGDQSGVDPFDASNRRPPPGVGRPNGMAMDGAAFGGVASWALDGLAGFLGPREGFIGFPELALLAQRPEYRSPVEIIATEATRCWIKFQAAGDVDKTEEIKKIEAEFKRLEVQAVFQKVSEQDGFFGRAHIYVDTGATDDPEELKKPIGTGGDDLSKIKISRGSLKALRAVEPVWVWPITYNSIDPLSPQWYRPETWFVISKEVHKTRLLTFIAREVPDLLKPAYMFGGQSLTQQMRPVVENWLSTRASVGRIVKKFSHNVIK